MATMREMTDAQLREFALRAGITYEKACSLRNNIMYRDEYNHRPEVRMKRRLANQRNWELSKSLRQFERKALEDGKWAERIGDGSQVNETEKEN